MKAATPHAPRPTPGLAPQNPVAATIARIGEIERRAADGDGIIDTGDVFAAIPSPDTVEPEHYQACVEALGDTGRELFVPPPKDALAPSGIAADEIDIEDSLRLHLQEISRFPLLTPEEEIELAKRIELGDGAARTRMIESNTRLVAACVFRRRRVPGVSALDLIQEGYLGLMTAVERFNWRRGYRFSTYAVWWIQRKLLDALPREARVIRLPLHTVSQIRHVRQVQAELAQALGREASEHELADELTRRARPEIVARLTKQYGRAPTDEEIAEAVRRRARYQAPRLRELLAASANALSLDAPMGGDEDDDDRHLVDTIAGSDDTNLRPPEDIIMANDASVALHARVHTMLYTLVTKRERDVLMHRFGFMGDGPLTHQETADTLGLSVAQIRKIERRALQRLRGPFLFESLRRELVEAGRAWRQKPRTPSVTRTGSAREQ